jgi:hypothetical protein
MANVIRLAYLKRRVQQVADALEAPQGDLWYNTDDGRRVSRVGAVFLDQPYGGFRIAQITNENGGERNLTDIYTKRELNAWISGFISAHYRGHTCR